MNDPQKHKRKDQAPTRQRPDTEEPPTLPSIPDEETDVGWGEESEYSRDDWYLRERPPHHD